MPRWTISTFTKWNIYTHDEDLKLLYTGQVSKYVDVYYQHTCLFQPVGWQLQTPQSTKHCFSICQTTCDSLTDCQAVSRLNLWDQKEENEYEES